MPASMYVVSQPMYFPWVGMLEQIKQCSTLIFYDDVQYTKGFFNRVQIKTENGSSWLTVPVKKNAQATSIRDTRVIDKFKKKHRAILRHSYAKCEFLEDMLKVVDEVFSPSISRLSELSALSTLALCEYFDWFGNSPPNVYYTSQMSTPGLGSERLVDLGLKLNADIYITGHGARHYLEHTLFEKKKMSVYYANYSLAPYPQKYGAFTPYVSALDLIANCGKDGVRYIQGDIVPWQHFLKRLENTH